MRLLNTETHELFEFMDDVPTYAILSHTWGYQLHVSLVRGGQCLLRLSLGPVNNIRRPLQGRPRWVPLVSKRLDIAGTSYAGRGPFLRPFLEPSRYQKHAPDWLSDITSIL